jgi:hypothetical protein
MVTDVLAMEDIMFKKEKLFAVLAVPILALTGGREKSWFEAAGT